ncbi:MAG: DUF4301 family protein [Bacteroidetes bacterium]|jgi:hypothetical protein|nr:DUF4301 family protein [Bacteroidota bacterium]
MINLSTKDKEQLEKQGITEKDVTVQIEQFKKGFPYLTLLKPATLNDGIKKMEQSDIRNYMKIYNEADETILKFVPASGAASRMFKSLFSYIEKAQDGEENKNNEDAKQVVNRIRDFAFYDALNKQINVNDALAKKQYKSLIEHILTAKGLNYGNLPKGLILFHSYDGASRTALEEHLTEGAMYARQKNDKVNIHFTVSPEHRAGFTALVEEMRPVYEARYGVTYEVTYSEQKPKTDTIAVDMNNEPFRDEDGSLLFRPGGHGALLENLNERDEDVIFVKNIDNVVPDRLKPTTVNYKKALGGLLIYLKDAIKKYINELQDDIEPTRLKEILAFTIQQLHTKPPQHITIDNKPEMVRFLKNTLNRPIRICGMVENEGEPGGGPFWVKNEDGSASLQIVEQAQINMNDKTQEEILKKSTHFNPVDLVCYVKDPNNQPFDLMKFRDDQTGFISKKSKNGKELKALELPGLWNGSMAFWNTIFVEVPIETFNPVKTINDLLRDNHQ